MEAEAYLKKVEKICKEHENAMKCMSEECPLWEYTCGLPRNEVDAKKVVAFVESYDLKAIPGLCRVCGYDLQAEDLKSYVVNYCPICGTKVEKPQKERELQARANR